MDYMPPVRREDRLAAVEAECVQLRELVRAHIATINNMLTTLEQQATVNEEVHGRITDVNRYVGRLRKNHEVRLFVLLGINFATALALLAVAWS